MQKSIRLFVLVAAVTFTAAPAMHAEQLGTNPHPQVTSPAPHGFSAFLAAVRSYFGM